MPTAPSSARESTSTPPPAEATPHITTTPATAASCTKPAEFRAQADQLHARFVDRTSDFLAYLNLWRYLRTQQRELSGSAFRRMCRAEYLNWLRFREWQDVVQQLRELSRPLGIELKPIKLPTKAQLRKAADEEKDNSHNQDVARAVKALGQSADTPAAESIHISMLVGLLSNLGSWDERTKDYLGARGTRFVIWPGSGLHRRNPDWVMAAELVETSRLFARTVARIKPEWVEQVGAHLVKRQYSEPFWSTRQGAAMAHEKVTLYGLPIIADRRVLLSKIGTQSARELARDMFICHGLVEGGWRHHHAFAKHNERELKEAREVEQRLRQVGLVADDDAQFTFFDERLPDRIVSGGHFNSWWKKEQKNNPDLLNFTQEFLLGATSVSDADFPGEWIQGDITLPIEYHFSPGKHADGLTIDVPVTLLPQLTDDGFDWLVPGMLDELVVATIWCRRPTSRAKSPRSCPRGRTSRTASPARPRSARHSRTRCAACARSILSPRTGRPSRCPRIWRSRSACARSAGLYSTRARRSRNCNAASHPRPARRLSRWSRARWRRRSTRRASNSCAVPLQNTTPDRPARALVPAPIPATALTTPVTRRARAGTGGRPRRRGMFPMRTISRRGRPACRSCPTSSNRLARAG